jgi:hypothetical protein
VVRPGVLHPAGGLSLAAARVVDVSPQREPDAEIRLRAAPDDISGTTLRCHPDGCVTSGVTSY